MAFRVGLSTSRGLFLVRPRTAVPCRFIAACAAEPPLADLQNGTSSLFAGVTGAPMTRSACDVAGPVGRDSRPGRWGEKERYTQANPI